MYTSSGYGNEINSTIKTQLESYYDSSLSSYSSYLADIEFCNDRTSTGSSTVYFGAYTRLYTNKAPIFTCPNEDRDLFTMTTASRGNKVLTKSIGMITQDEASYAGALAYSISPYYLNNYAEWYSGSPSKYGSPSNATVWYGGPSGFTFISTVSDVRNLRPYISLKADTVVLGGSGSSTDPYIITQ